MPKVFFRTADSKAFSKEIQSQVNYENALESIVNAFRLPKQNIRIVYCGDIKTQNFNLNQDIPHHIIHIVDKQKIGNEQITVSLTVNVGTESKKIGNIKTKSKAQVKEFLGNVFEESGIDKQKVKSADVFHRGVKLEQNDTFLDKGVANQDGLNVLLNIEYPDPADVLTLATLLYQRVDPTCLIVQAKPENMQYLFQFRKARNLNFFHTLQQKYQRTRKEVIFSQHPAYDLNLDPGSKAAFEPALEEVPVQENPVLTD